MDVALALDLLVPAAQYRGSLTANDQAAFDALDWHDARAKPSWTELQAAFAGYTPPSVILKSTIIARLSDSELEAAETARTTLALRDQVLWRDIVQVEIPSQKLSDFFTGLFGATRAAEILAPEA